jgi:hypothetical protein
LGLLTGFFYEEGNEFQFSINDGQYFDSRKLCFLQFADIQIFPEVWRIYVHGYFGPYSLSYIL